MDTLEGDSQVPAMSGTKVSVTKIAQAGEAPTWGVTRKKGRQYCVTKTAPVGAEVSGGPLEEMCQVQTGKGSSADYQIPMMPQKVEAPSVNADESQLKQIWKYTVHARQHVLAKTSAYRKYWTWPEWPTHSKS